MVTFDPKETARLVAELREDDARMTPAPWQTVGPPQGNGAFVDDVKYRTVADCDLPSDDETAGCTRLVDNAAGIARLRNNARPLADQLEAAAKEIERLQADVAAAAGECLVPVGEMPEGSHLRRVVLANRMWRYERDQLRADVERLTKERDAAVAGAFTAGQRSGAEEARLRLEVAVMRPVVDVSEDLYKALRDPDNEAPNEHMAFMNAMSFYRARKP